MSRRRENGSGTIYQRKNGSWCGQVDLSREPLRQRRTVYGRTREHVEAKIEALIYGLPEPPAPEVTRRKPDVCAPYLAFLRAARASKTHTAEQWQAKRDAIGCCVYCGDAESPLTADHVIPPSRGGDDSIGNLVPACYSCNGAKGAETGVEFIRRLLLSHG